MKTLKKTPIAMFLMVATALVMSACGSKNNNNSTSANLQCTTSPYGSTYGSNGYYGSSSYYGNGYSTQNTGTYYANGTTVAYAQCATINGTPVNGTTGYGTTGGTYNGYPVEACNQLQRYYYNPYNHGSGYCGTQANCSGSLLVDQTTNQLVYCQ